MQFVHGNWRSHWGGQHGKRTAAWEGERNLLFSPVALRARNDRPPPLPRDSAWLRVGSGLGGRLAGECKGVEDPAVIGAGRHGGRCETRIQCWLGNAGAVSIAVSLLVLRGLTEQLNPIGRTGGSPREPARAWRVLPWKPELEASMGGQQELYRLLLTVGRWATGLRGKMPGTGECGKERAGWAIRSRMQRLDQHVQRGHRRTPREYRLAGLMHN